MKLGISVSTYPSTFGPIVFSGEDVWTNLKIVKELGYQGVDLFVNRKTQADIEALGQFLEKLGLEVAMYLAIFLAEKGLKLSEHDEDKRKELVQEYKSQIGLAAKLKTKNMPIGLLRGGRVGDEPMAAYQNRLAKSIDELLDTASANGITLCVEPVNRYEINTFNTVEETLEFIEKYRFDTLKVLPDTFHMNIEDPSIENALLAAGDKIGHMHIADTNRLAPGCGHLDYKSLVKTLRKIGYNGYLTVEALPLPGPFACAKKSVEYMKGIMASDF